MSDQWLTVDEGWGRRAVEFATLLEPAACREYVAMHHHADVSPGDHLLDIACGSGLAMELAQLRGAAVAGIDASPRLVAVARDRVPDGDVRVGDMAALPWPDEAFDVVSSFRGLWATTPEALAEACRVLRPGGRLALTTWGHVKASPGMWALTPFTLAASAKVEAQARMKSLGRPEVGEAVLRDCGFVQVRRYDLPFVWEFPDPETFARALAATGPGYEAIQEVGADSFHEFCIAAAAEQLRQGLPLRAEIACVGLTARRPAPSTSLLLGEAATSPASAALVDDDVSTLGFVSNASRLWMHDPGLFEQLFAVINASAKRAGLSFPDRGVATVVACTDAGDPYCPLAWGQKLARATSPELAAALLAGETQQLDERGHALADWAHLVSRSPRSAGPADLEGLRRAGLDDAQILSLTLFIALRLAFSAVNGALGARPEPEYVALVEPAVRNAWEGVFAD